MKSRFGKAFVGVFAVFALGFGLQAHAAQLTSGQIQAVVQLLQSFNVDSATINQVTLSLGGSGVSIPVPTPTPAAWCPYLSYNLYIGLTDAQTGGQVSQLQQFLGMTPVGVFGPQTSARVTALQSQHAVYPVTGGVGPLTRSLIQRLCGGGVTPTPVPTPTSASFIFNSAFTLGVGQLATESTQGRLTVQLLSINGSTAQVTLGENCALGTQCFYHPTQTLTLQLNQLVTFQSYAVNLVGVSSDSATFFASNSNSSMGGGSSLNVSPTSGNAPLSVNFSASVPATGNYVIDYGDGTNSGQLNLIYPPCAFGTTCNPQANTTHTYQNAGTYTANLSSYIACLYSNPRCMIAQPAPIASAVVTVTGSSSSGAPIISSVSPTSGTVGTTVTLVGSGFTNDNIVHFGIGGTQHVASVNSTTITYTIPQQVGPCDITTASQICAQYLQLITAGVYNLSVSNTNGQSNTQSFTVSGTPLNGALSLVSPVSGQSFNRGQDLTIVWSASSVPSTAAVVLDLYTSAGTKVGAIAISNNSTNTYTWHIPGFPQNYMCTMQYPNGLCGTPIPTGQYYVKATAAADGFNANATQYGAAQSGVFTIVQQ